MRGKVQLSEAHLGLTKLADIAQATFSMHLKDNFDILVSLKFVEISQRCFW